MLSCFKENGENQKLKKVTDYKVYHSSNKPLDKNFSYKTEKLFTINDENSENPYISLSVAFDMDSKGNIFILDAKESAVHKYDKDGNFVKKFGRRGQGPGETIDPNFFCIVNDTLYYGGARTQNVVVCDTDGNFVKKIEIPIRNGNPEVPLYFTDNKILAQLFSYNDNTKKARIRIGLFDTKFNIVNLIDDIRGSLKKVYNKMREFTCSKEKIYLAHNSENDYIIDVYNKNGKLEAAIKKDYRKIKFNEFDLKNLNLKKEAKVYKKAITGMFYDNKRNLLFVKRSFERNEENKNKFLVDVFKDNQLLNTVELNIGKNLAGSNGFEQIKIAGDRLYFKNQDLRVYQITEK